MPFPLKMHAERFSAAGGMAGDGMKKPLGTPALTLLETVVRETVQNSWDARVVKAGVGYRIGLRELEPKEVTALREKVFAELPPFKGSAAPIRSFLSSPRPVVMEISDWGTRGLGGPTRANVIPARGDHDDFVSFVRNMGARRDVAGGGGTYGYGKSSLYQISQCATVLVDSVSFTLAGKPVHRFIGCHLGDAHDMKTYGRLTGRHWWGVNKGGDEDLVEPLTGRMATRLRNELGLPDRGANRTGTTLVVLAPDLQERSLDLIAAEIQETLLWYLWPKMLPAKDRKPAMKLAVEVNGHPIKMPSPETFPPIDLFVEAYQTLKAGGSGIEEISSDRPRKLLGRCCIRRGLRRPRQYLLPADESIIPKTSAHIALMRPVELVVKYIEGVSLPNETVEWAGVFICDDDPEVERAFANAEPPAHDDWVYDKMPKGPAKTFVRGALSRLKILASLYASPSSSSASGACDQPPLAKAADRLGNCIPSFAHGEPGDRNGSQRRGGGGGSGGIGRGRQWRVGEPRFVILEEGSAGAEAVFEVDVANGTNRSLRLVASTAAVIDGALADPDEQGDLSVTFVCWEDQAGNQLTTSTSLLTSPGTDATYRARIIVPAEAAAGVRITAAEEAGS